MGSAVGDIDDIDFDDLTSPRLTDVQRQILEFTEARHVEFDIDQMLAEAIEQASVGDELDATSSTYGGLAATQLSSQIFGPQRSKSYEVGTKWELLKQHLLVSGAAFQTIVTNARETAPAGLPGYTSGQIVPNAAYRVRGVDFEAAGKITERWSLLGGLVVMDPTITKSRPLRTISARVTFAVKRWPV